MESSSQTEILITYRKCIVYQIYCNVTGQIYIGSTFKTLTNRMRMHKSDYNNTASKQIIQRENYNCSILCEMLVSDKIFLRQAEQRYIDSTLNCINQIKAYLSPEDKKKYKREHGKKFYEKNKTKMNIKSKEYYQKNKDKVLEKGKEKIHCPCGKTYNKYNRSKHLKTKFHINNFYKN